MRWLLLLALAFYAQADTINNVVKQGAGASPPGWPFYLCNSAGTNCLAVNSDGSINVDATVAGSVAITNPATNYALETGGNLASAVSKLTSILTALGSPFQSGGSIGNTAFGISGTLPAFASIPTINLGTIGGTATQTTLAAVLAALGTPMQQTGGSVSITGTPNVAVTSSVLPTGAATQTTLVAILSALGSPLQAGGNVVITSSALPAGAATSANQTNGNQITQVSSLPSIPSGSNIIGKVDIDQTTPGTTNGVVVNSSALPAGAATATNQNTISSQQTSGTQKTQVVDGAGNVQGPQQAISGTNYAPVVLAASGVSGSSAPPRTIQMGGIGADGNLHSNKNDSLSGAQNVIVVPSSSISTYSACYNGLTIPTTPTDIFYVVGSSTKTVIINKVQMSGTETTVAMRLFSFITRSSADSGGTCVGAIAGPLDQNNAAVTATAFGCSVSPTTIGTLSAYVGATEFVLPATTGVDSSWPQIYKWGEPGGGQGVTLRGTSQIFAINTTTAAVGGSLNICAYWTEQ